MKNAEKFGFLKQPMIAVAILYLALAPAGAQNTVPPPPPSVTETPPSVPPGENTDRATVPNQPNTENRFSDEEYDSAPDPFGRGCPFNDQNLDLVS